MPSPSLSLEGPRLRQGLVIFICASLFALCPQWITGIPLPHRLEPDAEYFVTLWQTMLQPNLFSADGTLPRELPAGELLLLRFLVTVGQWLHLNPYVWSVTLSFLLLLFFCAGVYAVIYYSTGKSSLAFWVSLLSIIPVKALGASRFGIRVGGFVPQHLALVLAVWLLGVYLYGVRRDSKKIIGSYFLGCGMLANLYPQFWIQTAGTMLLAEALRVRKFSPMLIYGGAVIIAASPTIYSVLSQFGWSRPIDMELMHSRYPYLVIYPVTRRVIYYLRSFVVFALANAFLYLGLLKGRGLLEREALTPWWAIMKSSFILSILGLGVESFTPWTRFLISRASIWFTFASLTIIAAGLLSVWGGRLSPRQRALPLVCFASFFLIQSEAVPSALKMWRDYQGRSAHRELVEAALTLREASGPDDVILVPSGRGNDLAHTVRTYAVRSVYAAYKDGGASLINGEKARLWFERYERQTGILQKHDSAALIDFMRKEKIAFALLPAKGVGWDMASLEAYRFADVGEYLIIKVA